MEKKSKALELFGCGFNCAQSVAAAFSEAYGLGPEQAMRITGGMGGGFRSGEVCGAVAGAVAVVGLKYGQIRPGDREAKANCNQRTVELMDRFRKRHGSVLCRELLGCNTSVPEGLKEAQEKNLFQTVCTGLVGDAVDLLEELGY